VTKSYFADMNFLNYSSIIRSKFIFELLAKIDILT